MTLVAGLYRQYRPADRTPRQQAADTEVEQLFSQMGMGKAAGMNPGAISEYERRREKEERDSAKRKAKEAKEKAKRAEEDAKRKKTRSRRQPFDFEKVRIILRTHATYSWIHLDDAQEKPQLLTSIANASQAANNLVNAITLVNPQTDSLQTNERVQECLDNAKLCRKSIVRYIQLVENEELIGTLIDTNERIIAALEMYDKVAFFTLLIYFLSRNLHSFQHLYQLTLPK